VKICKTCHFWSLEKKGFCHLDERGVGQFWSCEYWQAGAPDKKVEKTEAGMACQTCATQTR
jgi:hypothetical protein